MKKLVFSFLVFLFIFSFSGVIKADTTTTYVDLKPQQPRSVERVDATAEHAKRERYDWAKKWKDEKFSQHISLAGSDSVNTDSPNAVSINTYSGSTYWQSDSTGDLVWTGACYNSGTTSPVFVKVEIDVYNASNTLIGSDYTYVWGGHNVRLNSTGTYTNAMGTNEAGFFRVWTSISYAAAASISYRYSYMTSAHANAFAQIDFNGGVYGSKYLNKLKLYGDIKNSSTNYVTYFTIVAFAALDSSNTDVIDVDWGYVDGASYGASSSAIFPGTSEPFDVWFLFADYDDASSSFLSSFEWDEAQTSALTEKDPPFGEFATPIDGSTVASSVPVTGWALDDSGVETVKIYRENGNALAYIGDATFVDGARPDVAALYPEYPNNTRAGWGYMMLTNFLPNGGNGTFVIHAIATDSAGKSKDLGAKTIYCDNANAVKPFGAIDTPTQGGNASGSSFINWGWVLTPQPNSIPTDGSTINVWIDGVSIGHPKYNINRSDLASLFPGYANSNGAAGYFYLDTTAYSNGLHTIQWTAKDSGNNSDGIGSRYFTINNTPRTSGSSNYSQNFKTAIMKPTRLTSSQIVSLPVNNMAPTRFVRGFTEISPLQGVTVSESDSNRISIMEMERLEIHLSQDNKNGCLYEGYLNVSGSLSALPVGSTLESKSGVFSWTPGPGFYGNYHLTFVESRPDGSVNRKDILITISPKEY